MAQAPDREKALDLAMAQIEKNFGKGSVMRLGEEVRQPISVIPTGSIALDVALGIGGLPRGRVVEIYGPESSGKTTLTRVLLGLESADGGSVEYCGEPVRGDVARKLRMQSGLVFQSPFDSLDPRWRIGRSIGEPLRMHHPDWPRERVAERVAEVLEMVSLDPETYLNRFPVDLSGGQAQRVSIARSLVTSPKVLLLDEPFSALDAFTRASLHEHLIALWEAEQPTLVIVTHDVEEAAFLGNRVVVMQPHPGRIFTEFSVGLSRPRDRLDDAFHDVKRQILKALDGSLSGQHGSAKANNSETAFWW